MKKTRRMTEQVIRFLRASEGLSVDEACCQHEISAPTYHRWKAKYGGMGIREAQQLRELEKENSELIYTLSESRVIFAEYRYLHNYKRPHRSLDLLTPKAYAKQLNGLCGSGRTTPSRP
jgi:putative transposase